MAGRRVFAAIDLSKDAREAVAAYSDQLRRSFTGLSVRWERPEKFHITLRFEAGADGSTLGEIARLMKAAAAETAPFELVLNGTGAFVNRRGPTVLWLGVDDASSQLLTELAGKLRDNRGRRFHPHVTIARIKHAATARELIAKHRNGTFATTAFLANELVLIESTLTPSGSTYGVLMREPLNGEN